MNKEISNEKIIQILLKILYAFLFIILAIIGIMAVFITVKMKTIYYMDSEGINIVVDNILLNVLGIVLFLMIIVLGAKISKKFSTKVVLGISLGTLLIFGISWAVMAENKIPIRADQEYIFQAAKEFVDGYFQSLIGYHYLALYPYQIGMVSFLELLIRLFADGAILAMRVVNVFAILAIVYYLYKITNILFRKEAVNKLVLIIATLFTPLIGMVTFVYGNMLGLALGMMAIYYTLSFLEQRKWNHAVCLVLTISMSILIKSNFEIYLIGMIIVFLLELALKWDKKLLIIIVVTLLSVNLSNVCLKTITEKRSNIDIKNGIPMINFVFMGLEEGSNDRPDGWYNGAAKYLYYDNNLDEEKTKETAIIWIAQRVGEMLHNPNEAYLFFLEKISSTWLEPTYQSIWVNEPLDKYEEVKDKIENNKLLISLYSGNINKILTKYLDIFQIVIYLLAAIFFLKNIKNVNANQAILAIIFVGGFLFHFVWETKSLYVIMYVVLLFPYVAAQLDKFINKEQ